MGRVLEFPLFFRLILHCMDGPRIIYPFICLQTLGCLHILAVASHAAGNVGALSETSGREHSSWSGGSLP